MKKLNALIILSIALFSGIVFAVTSLNDGQIMQIIKTANQAEINEARLILPETSNKDVKDFATLMITDHTKSSATELLLEQKTGIKAGDSDANKNLQNSSTAKLADLKKIKPGNIDRVYIDDQVLMHQMFLNDLDQTLIPQAQNAMLKSFLMDVKNVVISHLTQAQKIQSELAAIGE